MPDIRGKRILVIGGAGFIGSHIVDQLLGDDVLSVAVYDNFCRGTRDNLAHALRDPRVRVFEAGGDILQSDILGAAVAEADMVVHTAALWLLQCHEYPRAAFDVNIRGTFNVLEACRDHRIERLVYSSSASVYGDARNIPMTEEHPFDNQTFYGATKIAGEAMATAFHHRYGLPLVGLRYMNVYGPRQDYLGAYISVIMRFLDRIDRGEAPQIAGDGSQTYDFVSVSDTADANICALKSDAAGGFYNIGTGRGTSIRDLVDLLLELTDADVPMEFSDTVQTFVTHRVGATERAEAEIDFRAKTPLREGLIQLIEWRAGHKTRTHGGVAQ